jgi:hypothetical protein
MQYCTSRNLNKTNIYRIVSRTMEDFLKASNLTYFIEVRFIQIPEA